MNDNVYKFLAIYQTLATVLVGAGLSLFVGYRKWEIAPAAAKSATLAIVWLLTFVALCTVLLVVVGLLNWLDYRHEECDLTDQIVFRGFRHRPRLNNFFRWYETYIVVFIVGSVIFIWIYTCEIIVPNIK
ncbi:hypothetical protein [Actinoplanes sp. NPDC051494]|uniref:hypothetical protein n=1 Tax=Actinoplanes sp. NPDC051494 TaxID=3363907 RepID=UPI00378ABC35